MPFVHVELIEGRSAEVKAAIAKDIAESLMKHAGASKEAIHVIFEDMLKDNYYPGDSIK